MKREWRRYLKTKLSKIHITQEQTTTLHHLDSYPSHSILKVETIDEEEMEDDEE